MNNDGKSHFDSSERISPQISRRRFIAIGAIAAANLAIPTILTTVAEARARVRIRQRMLRFYNLHTGESLKTVYWENGQYNPEELDRINYILRDFRANEVKPIDPMLLDTLVGLQHRLGTTQPYQVISGYRSPLTNAMLHANSEGVAMRSMHIEGKAIDICVPGRKLAQVRRAALSLRAGGVGYYPRSGFVHVDTGRIRRW
jgi:uncharacterized protein YcbK (DUF882 family)